LDELIGLEGPKEQITVWRTEIQIDQMLAARGEAVSSTNENHIVLEGFALQQQPCHLHLRVARHADHVYIDLADAGNRVIAIGGGTWTISDTAPQRPNLQSARPSTQNRTWPNEHPSSALRRTHLTGSGARRMRSF
jgi:hypothetical protein